MEKSKKGKQALITLAGVIIRTREKNAATVNFRATKNEAERALPITLRTKGSKNFLADDVQPPLNQAANVPRTVRSAFLITVILLGTVAAGPWRADERNTRGWDLMTPQERIDHQARVRGFTDYQSCQAYRTQHHALMAERARQRGLNLPESGRDFCERLKPTRPPPSGSD